MSNIRIQTTQNVFIEFEAASIGERILAGLIDMLVITAYVILLVIFFFSFKLYEINENNIIFWIIFGTIFVLPIFFYHLVCEIFLNGQSIGKRARKIKVIRLDGTQPTLGNYLLRWLLRPIDSFFYHAVAIITISVNGKGQRIGDLAAGTTVISMVQRTMLQDTQLPQVADLYEPVYLQATKLSDQDIRIVKEAILNFSRNPTAQNEQVLVKLSEKIKEILYITDSTSDWDFLHIILRDYAYFAGKK